MNARLPIYDLEETIVAALPRTRRLVIRAPTGSGKSTQVPQILLRRRCVSKGQIVVLQPRRIAARLLAKRVASEMNSPLGGIVGYRVRFESLASPETRICFVTEGILLRDMLADPFLRRVSCLLFDEFHERHLYGDVTLALARELQRTKRPDLSLIVMSATLPDRTVEEYLHPCDVLESDGRQFPVDIRYRAFPSLPPLPIWEQAAMAWAESVRQGIDGDSLIFMPGTYEIQRTISALRDRPESKGRIILPLHGELPPDQQDAAVAPSDRLKIIVATNVAETSLTLEGVRLVIDSGLARIPRFDPHRGINTLLVERISRASADQRAGRAGRMAPGVCVRLWSEAEHYGRPARELPEVQRLDLSEIILGLKALGYSDSSAFPWLEHPSPRALARAEQLLRDLGAAQEADGSITEMGRRMVAFPLHPRYSRMLLEADRLGAVRPAALIAALTQGRDLLVRQAERDQEERRDDLFGDASASDFFRLMRAFAYAERHGFSLEACRRVGIHSIAAQQAARLYDMFLRIAAAEGLRVDHPASSDEAVQKCVLTAFADQLAVRIDGGTLRCRLVHQRKGILSRESRVQKHRLFVAAEVNEIEGREVEVQLSLATAVKPEWLEELFPDAVREECVAVWDKSARRVYAERRRLFRDLVIDTVRFDQPPPDQAARLLADRVLAGELTLKRWDETVERWITRVNCLATWRPELHIPLIDADARRIMVESICAGAVSYKEIKEREVFPTVRSWLTAEQHAALDRLVPERIQLPGGRWVRVLYSEDAPPSIAATIQELYGTEAVPTIDGGRMPLTVKVLAPNRRPVQITRDLQGFWRDQYPRVKQELQRKYPKHEWR